ncbi:MAG: ATP-binding protein [Planctomycetota bacterium]|jgi:PAS domain S-box-containing protein
MFAGKSQPVSILLLLLWLLGAPWTGAFGSESTPQLSLTDQERQWLAEHPVIQVGCDTRWAPVEYLDKQGQYQGISIDYLREVERLLGIQFDIVPKQPWQQLLQRAEHRQLDMLACATETTLRSEYLLFTRPYLTLPIMIYTRDEVAYIGDLNDLTGQRVAVVNRYAVDEWLSRDYPDIELVRVDNMEMAVRMLGRGEVFAFAGSILPSGHYIRQQGYGNIKVSGQTPYQCELAMAIRNDWPFFAGIVQKAIDAIPLSRQQAVYNKWIPIEYEREFDKALIWKILAPALVLIAVLGLWNYSLYVQIRKRRAVEAELRNHQDHLEEMAAERAEELKQSQRRYRLLAENATDMISLHDRDGRYLYVSPSTLMVAGYTEEQLLGQDPYDFFHPDDAEKIRSHHSDLLNGDKMPAIQYRFRRSDGGYVWLESISGLLKEEESGQQTIMVISRDISERKRGEHEREKLLQQLQTKSAELESLVYTCSHDFRSPMLNIHGFIQELNHSLETICKLCHEVHLEASLEKELSAALDEIPVSMNIIKMNTKKMEILLNGLLKVCRAGRREAALMQQDMNELLREIVETMTYQLKELNAEIRIKELPECVGDFDMMLQVFSNLIDNALKYHSPDRAPLITVSGRKNEDEVTYCIEDNGVGIKPDDYQKVFDIFHRVEPNDMVQGEGLGLTIIRRIMDLHQGRVWVESEPGSGSRFYISIPIKPIPVQTIE